MKYVIVSAREAGKRASLMFCTLALVAGLTACGGGGVGVDALGDVVEAKKPLSPGNSPNAQAAQTTQTATPTTSVTETAPTTVTAYTAPTNPPTYTEPVSSTTYTEPVSSPTQVATTTPTTAPPTVSTIPPGTYALAALGSPRILISDAATLNRLRVMVASQTPSAMRFKSMADAQLTGAKTYGFEPWQVALMGRITGDSAYCRLAVDQTDSYVASEEALIAAGQRPSFVNANSNYLYVGDKVGNLAIVYDWCRTNMTAGQRERWRNFANQAVFNVWNPTLAQWGGVSYPTKAWAINNPGNNFHYSFLEATMLLGLATYGENPQAQTWLDTFRIAKIENQLIPTFVTDLVGGGSREGTGYGVAMARLFKLYDWWERSTGERLADRTPHAKASLAYMMHTIAPTLNRVAPTGDHSRDQTAALFDYHRNYLQVLMRLYPNEAISGAAKTLLAQSSVPLMSKPFLYFSDFLYDDTDIPAQPLTTLATGYWGSGTGNFAMRSSWATDATYANVICGPYFDSHAHQDQGSFVLYKGSWLAFDAQQAQYGVSGAAINHNLVRIEQSGTVVTQPYYTTCDMAALADTPAYSYGYARITPSYKGKAAVVRVEREFLFIKPGTVVILDRVQTTGTGIQRIWALNLPSTPTVNGDRLTMVRGANRLDVIRLAPAGLTTQLRSFPTAAVIPEYGSGVRVDVADSAGDSSVFLNVLGTDGAMVDAVRSDAAGQTGTQITLAGGRIATIRFSTAGSGGTIDIRNPDGSIVVSGALPTTVVTPGTYR